MGRQLDQGLRQRVATARVARLATVRPDGTPHVAPITFALVGDTLVTAVDDKPKSTTALQRLRNIAANPAVSIVVDHYDDDWSRLWWVRADGIARLVETDEEAHISAVAHLVDKYPPYRDNPPRGPAILIEIHGWRAWSAE